MTTPNPSTESGWTVRLASGEELPVKSTDTLTRWIIESRVGPDCLLSRAGGSYKRLGDIQRFAPLFRVMEQRSERERFTPSRPLEAVRNPLAAAELSEATTEVSEPDPVAPTAPDPAAAEEPTPSEDAAQRAAAEPVQVPAFGDAAAVRAERTTPTPIDPLAGFDNGPSSWWWILALAALGAAVAMLIRFL